MEEKRGSCLTLADFLREKMAQIDHWFYEEDSFPRFFREEDDSFLATSELWEIGEESFSSWSGKRPSCGCRRDLFCGWKDADSCPNYSANENRAFRRGGSRFCSMARK